VRYDLVAVLAAAVCATLAGARSYSAIAKWVHDTAAGSAGLHGQVPDLVTIWRVLTAVDPAALDRAIGAWAAARLPPGRQPQARTVLAVDGKTLRGARTAKSMLVRARDSFLVLLDPDSISGGKPADGGRPALAPKCRNYASVQ
jgi:hypothetical protein